jgi:hypothetical protein
MSCGADGAVVDRAPAQATGGGLSRSFDRAECIRAGRRGVIDPQALEDAIHVRGDPP